MSSRNLIIINVSPLEYCNVLLTPAVEECLPQVTTVQFLNLRMTHLLHRSNSSHRLNVLIRNDNLFIYDHIMIHDSMNEIKSYIWYITSTVLLSNSLPKYSDFKIVDNTSNNSS